MSTEDTSTPASGDLETLLAMGSQPARRRGGPLKSGSTAGRYFVLDHIGSGGMGDVYAAYDPKLDRRIALKLMHPPRAKEKEEGGIARMMREAQAMAKVSHPNVITVFDVGMLDNRVFLAMEFIDGCNLEEWLADEERGWDEIRDVFVLAGKGLAGAHASGLVHRDFKPANVLVGNDGGVRVADFGLAFGSADGTESVPADIEVSSPEGSMSATRTFLSRLTATGMTMGTPAYMSPEQHGSSGVDARSDQFSFCVALFEAWFGHRPFSGETFHSLAANVCAGKIEEPPRDSRIPARLRRALSKGLSVSREDRYLAMGQLLQALSPSTLDRRAVVLAALGVAGIAAGATWAVVGGAEPTCDDAAEQLGVAWDSGRRDSVRRALSDSDASHASSTADRVVSSVDAYAAQWIDGYGNACAATHVQHEQSETAFDLRMVCLRERRAALDALSGALAAGHTSAVNLAVDAIQRLPEVSDCEDTERLLLGAPPPARPEDRDRLEQLEASLHRASALGDLGAAVEAEELAVEVLEGAREVGYAPFIARALAGLGSAQSGNGKEELGEQTLLVALEESIAAGATVEVARIASRMVYAVSQRTEHYEAADIYYRIALAAQRRSQAGEERRASLLINYGQSLSARGRPEEGLALLTEAVEIRERTYGLRSLAYARARLSTGTTLYQLGRIDDLAEINDEVVALYHTHYGEEHPKSLSLLGRMGVVNFLRGEFTASRDQFLRAISVTERALGPTHIDVVDLRANLGLVYTALGEFDAAASSLDIALAKYVEEYGETAQVGEYLINRGGVELTRGRTEDARPYFERARAIYSDDPDRRGHLGTVLGELATVELAAGARDTAVELALEAHRLQSADYGASHPRTRAGFVRLLDTLVNAGSEQMARELLDASAEQVAEVSTPELDAGLNFVRARLLHAQQPSVARELAVQARTVLAGERYRFEHGQVLEDIDAWLAANAGTSD